MKRNRRWQTLGIALITLCSTSAFADGGQCYLHRDLPIERQLRRLSIDLRGNVPEMADYAAVTNKTELPDPTIAAYLDSDEFRLQMRRYHEDLLWTNPSTSLSDVGFSLSSTNFAGAGPTVFFVSSTSKSRLYRGGDGTHPCQDKPQSALGYDANGLPLTEPAGVDAVGAYVAEGWVEVHPYWEVDPAKTIKVCAFDAQLAETYTLPPADADAGTWPCDHLLAVGKAKSCGCGPNLSYCIQSATVQPLVLSSMREQLLRLVDDYTDGTRPYSQILTTKRAWINGPLVHYFHYLGQRQSLSRTQNVHQPSDGPLPDLPFTATDTWVEIQREDPHAGILTLPAYLLRFQTNRGRANRYRIAFEGQYFEPPSTKDTACNKDGDDLTQRCVCRQCHLTLEPLAAHFGQFVEAGTTSLHDFVSSYPTLKTCAKGVQGPASTGWCDRFYTTVPDVADPDIRPYKLKALRYADVDHPLVQKHFEDGPSGLAKADIKSPNHLFHSVATRQMFRFLMKRDPVLDKTAPDYEGDLIDTIAAEFQAHDNLKLLVTRLVKLPMYRRMP
ncbi:MAG: hypothetical protein ABI193_14375 [Minicystis sp.]